MRSLRLCAGALFALTTLAIGQQISGPPLFRVSGEEVILHLRFVDRSGRDVIDISPQDIQIFEDGTQQKLRRLYRSNEPFDVALVLDTSGSTHENIPLIREYSGQFVSQLPEGHRVLVLSFDDEVYVDCDWTEDLDKAQEAIAGIDTNTKAGGTVAYEAITLAAEKKFNRQMLRKALIYYTDAIDHGSKISKDESIKVIEESGIIVFPIQFDSRDHYRRLHDPNSRRSITEPDLEPPVGTTGRKVGGIFVGSGRSSERDQAEYVAQSMYDSAQKYLKRIAFVSGGRYFETLKVQDLSLAYDKIIEEMSRAYTLTYVPAREKPDGQFHPVKVTTNRAGVAVVGAREGYWAK